MAKYMEYAEKSFKEYDDLKNENRKLKNILHEIWDIIDDPNLDDEGANEKVSLLDIFNEILEEKEEADKKKDEDEDESDEDESDEEDKPIKNVLNTTIKNTEEYKKILKDEEDKMFEDADEDETDYKIINKGKFNHEIKEALKKKEFTKKEVMEFAKHKKQKEDEIKRKMEEMKKEDKGINIGELCSSSEDEKEKEEKEKARKKKYPTTTDEEESEEEEEEVKNNETMIRAYLITKNITKFHHLQEEDLKDYSKHYKYFKIKTTAKCYVVEYFNVRSDHRKTTLKTLRFKKP